MPDVEWLHLEALARIEASSEDADHPFDHALVTGRRTEWRAAEPGMQLIQVRFHEPRHVRRIRLVIADPDQARTQEFTITWSSNRGERHRDVVRQQFNFSPSGATTEVEDYCVDLPGATALALRIVPDVKGGAAVARLTELLVA
jgi:F5/8 type C domain